MNRQIASSIMLGPTKKPTLGFKDKSQLPVALCIAICTDRRSRRHSENSDFETKSVVRT